MSKKSALERLLGNVVRQLRKHRGISPEDFGDRVGGDYVLYLENLEQVARGLDMATWELMRLAEEASSEPPTG